MFANMNMKRLLELAGAPGAPMPDMNGGPEREEGPEAPEGEMTAGDSGDDEGTENHLSKETDVFQETHDCVEKLLSFLHSQEDYEENRGKSEEYSEMEEYANKLLSEMKKHLEGYGSDEDKGEGEPSMGGEPDSDEGLHGEMPSGGSELPKLPEGWAYIAGIGPNVGSKKYFSK
jgi:hypothetical protein